MPYTPATLTIPASEDGQRLDRFLKNRFPAVPFTGLQKLLRTGKIRVGGKKAAHDARLAAGDILTLPPSLPSGGQGAATARPTSRDQRHSPYQLTHADRALITANILFEDEHLLALNKPAGLAAQAGGGHPAQPGKGGNTRSLDRILAAIYPDNPPKLAHRLDKDTTGVIILGKTRAAVAALGAQFQAHSAAKTYWAIVTGTLPATSGAITLPLKKILVGQGARSIVVPQARGALASQGEPAHTTWHLLHSLSEAEHLIAATPHTGRMNQLRVHLAAVHLPILGDDKYGAPSHQGGPDKAKLMLHARSLTVRHPFTGQLLTCTAPLPTPFAHALKELPTLPDGLAH